MTTREAAEWFRSKMFQSALRASKNRFYREMGADPTWAKTTAIGQLLFCAQQLIAAGEYDKGAEVILKASKIQGWLGPDTNVSVFAGLSGRELEEIRSKLAQRADGSSSQPTGEPLTN